MKKYFIIPAVCPICGHAIEIRMDNESKMLVCPNNDCEGKLINKLDHFCGKKGLDIKGLSKATLEKLMDLMCHNARKRFNIPLGNSFTIWDLNNKYAINPDDFVSKGKSTPFEGFEVYGKCLLTVKDGNIAYNNI